MLRPNVLRSVLEAWHSFPGDDCTWICCFTMLLSCISSEKPAGHRQPISRQVWQLAPCPWPGLAFGWEGVLQRMLALPKLLQE